ncbi:two-component system, NtrC family, sensor histidine kinase HydH [Sulfobacillus thermosulfidooxidans DSM 9293]|uniref:histidine kinase n=1 Tax=Sulfobacillus thermosulfidooxidans (strain DSM 9293 / VKM B-1269 / AT-1) TaxID=929705 RepID=A0A1W1W8J2_SULTA|nr:HAMP domain-containing sensor histidine kinase [Sulfobacillus thermosulfidooxidans]SMC02565.1 two-component system, NtrC family, sensor histidine kinase HydH [Sulfobacillus thermosulfidooxidans DSM 9293]
MPHTFHILPHIQVTNDFLVGKEVLDRLPLPILFVAPSRHIVWRNRYASWFSANRKTVRALLRQVVEKEEYQRLDPVVLSSGVNVTVESQPVRNLTGTVEGYLLWVSDNLSGLAGDFLQTGIAIAQDGQFVLVNYHARLLLGENIVGQRWNSVAWLPPWHVVIRRGQQSFFALTQEGFEIRIHTHYPWVIFEAVPQRLIEQDKISVQFASAMMHEVRNPLAALSGYVELALMQVGEGPAKEYLSRAMGEIDRLSRLTSDLMWLSRSQEIQKQWCLVSTLVDKAWSVIRTTTSETLQLQTRFSPEDRIYVDPDRFEQILINVFKNAAEAMPEGGRITVFVEQDDTWQYIRIHDNGPGIPDEVMRTLFLERRTTKQDGHGLGLFIIKQLVDAHHGRLDISSSRQDGTTVSIILPYPEPN